jgi:thiol-disulfide isomerase/thioredoxin
MQNKSASIRIFSLTIIMILLSACSSTNLAKESQVTNDQVTTESSSTEESGVASGDYISYQNYKLEVEKYQDSRVVLFFNASWCSTCKIARDNFEANLKEIPADMAIVVVDFDNSADLRKKYGVTLQHTFVHINSQEEAIKKWSGSTTISELIQETT